MQKNNLAVHTFFYMTLLVDIKSERFIHDSLLKAAEEVLEVVRARWNKEGKVDAFAIAWPAEAVAADGGEPIEGPCLAVLEPLATEKRQASLKQFAQRTNAYALLLIEQRAQAEVHAVFESPHGSRTWTIRLERHGDRWVAKRPIVESGGESLGLILGLASGGD